MAIREELSSRFPPALLAAEKIGEIIEEFQRTVSGLRPDLLRRVPYESNNPSLWYYYLDREIMEKALDYLDAPVGRVGAKEAPIAFAESLESAVLPSVADIKKSCLTATGSA